MDESFLNEFKHKKSRKKNEKYQGKHVKKVKRIRLKPIPFFIVVVILSSVILINLNNIYEWKQDNENINILEENIEEIIKVTEIEEEGEIINPPPEKESDYWYYIKVPFHDINFTGLLEKNNDTVGFINIRNTNINYPIVQSTNNDYYLNHAYDKSYNEAGWVYMDYRNNNSFNDFNTIIYGHGRLNKTVFGSLKNLLNKSWQTNKDNYIMTISTPQKNSVYQIFSIYTIKAESYYIKTAFDNDSSKETWIEEMNNRNISLMKSPANVNDKIITLSTCLNNDGDRVVVHAKLIKIQNKETE